MSSDSNEGCLRSIDTILAAEFFTIVGRLGSELGVLLVQLVHHLHVFFLLSRGQTSKLAVTLVDDLLQVTLCL